MAAAYSKDGKKLASGACDATVRLWDLTSGILEMTLEGHTGDVNAVAYRPDGKHVASGSDDHTVRLWDARTGTSLYSLNHESWVWTVAYSPDGKKLASISDSSIVVWSCEVDAYMALLYAFARKAAENKKVTMPLFQSQDLEWYQAYKRFERIKNPEIRALIKKSFTLADNQSLNLTDRGQCIVL